MRCVICAKDFKDEKSFNAHLRGHKLTVQKYYQENFPRYDLYEHKTLINFKSSEQYLFDEFNSKANLHSWLKEHSHAEARALLQSTLWRYFTWKKLTKAPLSVELRSINCLPSTKIFNLYFEGGYAQCCKLAKIPNRFQYEPMQFEAPKELNIIVDTREQNPISFPKNVFVVNEKLDVGDYALASRKIKLSIERKSLPDFIGTLSSGYERFVREVQRAENAGVKLIVLVEENIIQAMSFNYHPDHYGQVTPEFIFHKMRQLCRTFDNIQFLFAYPKNEIPQIAYKLLGCGERVFNYDLQYQIDQGWL